MKRSKHNFFEHISTKITNWTGSPVAFGVASLIIIVWVITGPIFNYSDTWQLVINTGTTIITFLMVFLIQKSQNKDSKAIHLKLNELLASHQGASNRMVDIEDMNEQELDQLHKFYVQLSELAELEDDITCTHSIDAAAANHNSKLEHLKTKPHYTNALKNRSKKSY